MEPDNPRMGFLHDLRVLVAAIQLTVDEICVGDQGSPETREALRDQTSLLAEILRIATELEEPTESSVGVVDARAVVWLARSRRDDVFMGRMTHAVLVRVDVASLLELLDLVTGWVTTGERRARIVAMPSPPSLFVMAAAESTATQEPQPDREMEQAIMSIAGSARVEVSLRSNPRSAKLELLAADPDDSV